jgi:hypothetical protein
MKSIVLPVLLALFSAQAAAQPSTPASQATALRKARIKIWTGVTMAAAGAFFVILPMAFVESSEPNDGTLLGSSGLMGVGAASCIGASGKSETLRSRPLHSWWHLGEGTRWYLECVAKLTAGRVTPDGAPRLARSRHP